MILELDVAFFGDLDRNPLEDLKSVLFGATGSGGHQVLVGIDKIFILTEFEDAFVGGLDFEVTVPRGSLGIFDIERPQPRTRQGDVLTGSGHGHWKRDV